jgi:NTP pyrophosphatase (non-canonical NTP hydrolase)
MNDLILEWANKRDLIHPWNAKTQFIKLTEEVGELGQGILKDKPEQIYDTLGDIQVVLIILAEQLGYDYNEALAYAYEEIKERKGKTEHGTFIKEADL